MVNIIQVMARGKPSVLTTRFTNMAVLEKEIIEELSNRPDCLPLLYEFINVIGRGMARNNRCI